jgi:hypothetical protein
MSNRPPRKPDQYHLNPQQAGALLGPACATLRELEARLQHYVDRLPLEAADDAEALRAAHGALATARGEVERLWAARGRRAGG